nr:hypothetical protein Itr_chr06CG21770 [Ipomoea trifida]
MLQKELLGKSPLAEGTIKHYIWKRHNKCFPWLPAKGDFAMQCSYRLHLNSMLHFAWVRVNPLLFGQEPGHMPFTKVAYSFINMALCMNEPIFDADHLRINLSLWLPQTTIPFFIFLGVSKKEEEAKYMLEEFCSENKNENLVVNDPISGWAKAFNPRQRGRDGKWHNGGRGPRH